MAEDNSKEPGIKNAEDVEDIEDLEYKKALETLNTSKSYRIRARKEEKLKAKEASKAAFRSNKKYGSFAEACKKDRLIPLCLIMAVLTVLGAVLYFILPSVYIKSLGLNVDQLRSRYSQTEIYTTYLSEYNFSIPEITYTENEKPQLNDFNTVINNTATTFSTGLTGSTRDIDGKITELNLVVEFSSDDSYFDFLLLYFSSYLQAVDPSLTTDDARMMSSNALSGIGGPDTDYIIRRELAYRCMLVRTDDTNSFIVFQMRNSKSL